METKTAFLCPGQGAQYVGMGKDLYENLPQVKDLYERVDDMLGYSLSKMSFYGPQKELAKTVHAQPAVLIHSLAVADALRANGIQPVVVAGHSLGEYAAHALAGTCTYDEIVKIIKERGVLMHQASKQRPGSMVAIIGLSANAVERMCTEAAVHGIVTPANYNCPGQIVVSGERNALQAVMKSAREGGAKRVVKLSVSGAFHSPLMDDVLTKFRDTLSKIDMREPILTLLSNVTAAPVVKPNEIISTLVKQLRMPVRWEETMAAMLEMGISSFVAVGPGKILKGLMLRMRGSADVVSIGNMRDLDTFLNRASYQ